MPPPDPNFRSARLEIHQLNVGQGDSVLIINRDLAKVKKAIEDAGRPVPAYPINYVPYALSTFGSQNPVSLAGTVQKALLVDGGDDIYGDGLIFYLEDLGAVVPRQVWQPNLMLLVSHYHDDHIAGLRSVFKKRVEPRQKGEKVKFIERFRPQAVYRSDPDAKADPRTERYRLFAGDLVDASVLATGNKTQQIPLPLGGWDAGTKKQTVIKLGSGVSDIPINVHVVASGQYVCRPDGLLPAPIASVGKKPDQNDRSVVLVLEYGSFRCFLGGDIAGNGGPNGGNDGTNAMSTKSKKFFSRHADVETTLGTELEKLFPRTPDKELKAKGHKYLSPGYCTVMKANHHGSSSSVDVHLLATLRPSVLLISSGVKSRFHHHPTQQVLDRATQQTTPQWWLRDGTGPISNTIRRIYVTEVAQKVKGAAFDVDLHGAPILGDIVVRPVDEDLVAIRDATAPGRQLRVQVYGNGAQSSIVDLDRTELRPSAPKNRPDDIYPIGPFEHADLH